jgi:flavin-dependent dehydrogenase
MPYVLVLDKVMTISATVAWSDLSARTWDVVVVGAGPAGSIAARELARHGLAILLVDKAAFPRWKVCGCCLNGAALSTLESVGLADVATDCGAVPLTVTRIAAKGAEATISLARGMALSRTTFDAALVKAAINGGAHFLPEATAAIGAATQNNRKVTLRHQLHAARVKARVVLAADGLAGRSIAAEPDLCAVTEHSSRIGVGTVLGEAPEFYARGTIYLACAPAGYLGLVQLEDGRVDLAGAFDMAATREIGGPGNLALAILRRVGWPPIPKMSDAAWRGTVALTRRPARLADERLFVIGDAAGYVEPFTGEGMAWAVASAVAVAPLAAAASRRWQTSFESEWTRRHRQSVGRRQFLCRWVARGLRHPGMVGTILNLLSRWPNLASPLVQRLNGPESPLEGIAS